MELYKVYFYPLRTCGVDYKHYDLVDFVYCNYYEYDSFDLSYRLYVTFKGKQYPCNKFPDFQFKSAEKVDVE